MFRRNHIHRLSELRSFSFSPAAFAIWKSWNHRINVSTGSLAESFHNIIAWNYTVHRVFCSFSKFQMEFPSLIQDFAELILHPIDERNVDSRSDTNTYSVIHHNHESRVAAPSPTKPHVQRASTICSPRKRRHRRNRIVLASTIAKGTTSFSSWEKQIRRHRNHALTDFDHILCVKAVGHVMN